MTLYVVIGNGQNFEPARLGIVPGWTRFGSHGREGYLIGTYATATDARGVAVAAAVVASVRSLSYHFRATALQLEMYLETWRATQKRANELSPGEWAEYGVYGVRIVETEVQE